MSLILYLHPLASYCHKVLIAFYENDVQFTPEIVDLGSPDSAAPLLTKWPLAKIPVLHDSHRNQTIPETSIIIEYVQQHYPGTVALLPADAEGRFQTRLWDRFFDQYVSTPMQKIVADRVRPEDAKDPFGVAEARRALDAAYAMADGQLLEKMFATGNDFTLADCAAVPALFYAGILQPFARKWRNLEAYFERILERPSVQRTLDEARPYFPMFPYRDLMPERFLGK